MKNLASNAALLILLSFFCTKQLVAQGKNGNLIPESVREAEMAKYPKAEVKIWDTAKNQYVAKIIEKGQRRIVTFDHYAFWIKTESKVKWPWHMPEAVKNAYHKSIYHNWNMYAVRIIDTPSGQIYKIMVDDRNHPIDIYHQSVFTRDRSVAFKADGEIVDAGNPEDKGAL